MDMLRLTIDLPAMYQRLKSHRLPPMVSDTGYHVHAFMQDVFSGRSPTPFRVVTNTQPGTETHHSSRELDVLAYTANATPILEHKNSSRRAGVVRLDSKQLPASFPPNTVLGFSLLACPVVRMSAASARHKKGAEVDVFLRECWARGSDTQLARETIYGEWLAERFRSGAGAELVGARVVSYKQQQLLRKTQGPDRKSRKANKPVVEYQGRLRVTDSSAFASTLQRGIGRHRAFGFGMLLLRRA